MKKFHLIYILLLLGFISCDYGEDFDGFKEELVGGAVQAVYVSPSSATLYIDSELPTMRAFVTPIYAADTTVSWMSDHPEILSVNAETGELSWGTIANSEVTISAVSNSNTNAVGSCTFTIRNSRNNYGYVDARSIGLWILDRNIGASTTPAENATWSFPPSAKGAAGNYYQWGHNDPVANIENGGANGNGWGDTWHYESDGRNLNSGLPGRDPYWSADNQAFVDWSNESNLPGGMDGWRLPTREELEQIAYYINEDNFRNAEDKSKARVLWNDLGFVPTAYLDIYYEGYLTWRITSSCILWSSDYDPETNLVWCLQIDVSNGVISTKMVQYEINRAMPIRLVRDASSFDREDESESSYEQ